ncbi:DUF1330 domain-containing protein, partial [Aeromonas caviae]
MEAFVVFTREETTDPEELATYSAGVGPSFDGHDVTFLAAYGAMEHLEGPPVEGAVILVLRGILGKWKLTDRVLVNWLSPNT